MSRKLEATIKDNAELREAVLDAAKNNHIWIDSFSLIRPTDETLKNIGTAVIDMLRKPENLLPLYLGSSLDGEITELQKLTPVLYLSINAS